MRRFCSFVALLTVVALIAAACGDDSNEGTDTSPTTAPTTVAPDDLNDPPDDASTTAAGDAELIASTRGITETTIRVGVAIADVSQFTNSGDQVARYRAVADQINAEGGVIGRQIELVVAEWPLLDLGGFDKACVEMTQDEELFAVITRTPANFGAMTCFTELGGTITINGVDLDASEVEQSDGMLFSVLSDSSGALIGGLPLLADELTDARVAITAADDPGGAEVAEEIHALLTDLDVAVAATTISAIAYADDPTAALTELDRFAEIWSTSGATHVIGIGNGVVGAAYAIDNNGLQADMALITPNLSARVLNSLNADLASLTMIGVAAPNPGSVAEEGLHGMPECVALMEETLDEEVIFFPEEEELNALPSAFMACASFDFLIAALEEIGPNPTQDDFLALTNGGFSFDMTSAGAASVAEGKAYLNDDPGEIYDWDGSAFSPRG